MRSQWQSIKKVLSRRGVVTLSRAFYVYFFGQVKNEGVSRSQLLYRLRSHELLGLYRELQEPRVLLWVDGHEIFPRLLRLINRAKHTIAIRMFIWNDDRTGRKFAQSVLQAADRGVHVDITKEAIGDVFELNEDFLSTSAEKTPLWERFWHHPNITVRWAKQPDHAKIFLIDNHTLLVGSMNISDLYRYQSHDYLVELQGQAYVLEYLGEGLSQPESGARLITNSVQKKETRAAVMGLLESAKSSILLEQAYFSDFKVIAKLAEKSRAGVKVTIILSEKQMTYAHRNKKAVWMLLKEGNPKRIHIRFLPQWLHAKAIFIDRQRAFVGSANMMASSLDSMGEVSVLVGRNQRKFIGKLAASTERMISASRRFEGEASFSIIDRILAWLNL